MANADGQFSWRGSGVFETVSTETVYCDYPDPEDPDLVCGYIGLGDVYTDDWKNRTWTCPRCGALHDDGVDHPDPDSLHEAQRDRDL